ncbi:MAG: hypothetical protein IPH82_01440 [Chloroflexi bacterium]|nr:hypothetical protein [Chloroflexota bacterium]
MLMPLLLLWAVSARTMENYTTPDSPIFTGNFARRAAAGSVTDSGGELEYSVWGGVAA